MSSSISNSQSHSTFPTSIPLSNLSSQSLPPSSSSSSPSSTAAPSPSSSSASLPAHKHKHSHRRSATLNANFPAPPHPGTMPVPFLYTNEAPRGMKQMTIDQAEESIRSGNNGNGVGIGGVTAHKQQQLSSSSRSTVASATGLRSKQQQTEDLDALEKGTITDSSDEDEELMRLRGGCCNSANCCDCLCGGVWLESGPCVCRTAGDGCLGTVFCCVIWPLNVIWGGLVGLMNCLTCGCCQCGVATCGTRPAA